MRSRRILAAAAAVALVLTLAVAPSPAFANNGEDGVYVPKSKWKGYMLNVTGSILGAAMPQSWQREQMAYKYSQNGMPSAEQLNAMYGHRDMVRNVDGQLIPRVSGHGTYDDVVLRELDDQLEGRSTRKKIAVPSTKPANFIKNVAGLGSVVLGLPMAFQFGSGVASLFGLDSEGAVCQGTQENGEPITQFFTGVDCEAWRLNAEYVPNTDAEGGLGPLVYNGTTYIAYQGFAAHPSGAPNWYGMFCYTRSAAPPAGMQLMHRHPNNPNDFVTALNPDPYGLNQCMGPYSGVTHWAYGPDAFGNGGTVRDPEVYLVEIPSGGGAPIVRAQQEELTGDPDRTMTCTITYTDGSTDSLTSDPYKESSGSVSPLGCPEPDENKTVAGVAVTEAGSGQVHELLNEPTTQPYKDFQEDYPECHTGVCMLDLLYVKPDESLGSCFDLEDGCPGWFEDPAKTDKYECMYGVKEVDLDECAVYAGLFMPQRVESGSPYSDPLTGIWSGGKNAPKPSDKAMSYTITNPANTRTCDFSGLGFDPVGWVMRPVQCWSEWAAIPRPAVVELHQARLDDNWKQSTPGQYATALAGVGDAFGALGAGHCGGFSFNLPVPAADGSRTSRPSTLLNSCPGSPLEPVATGIYWLLSGLAVWLGVLACRRLLFKFVGM